MRLLAKFRPGTGRGTALAVEGAVEADLHFAKSSLTLPDPSTASRRSPSPFRGGTSL
jgi:hypothetical protein